MRWNLPAPFVSKAIPKTSHVAPNGVPFSAAYNANVLDGKNGEEEIFVCTVIPILVHDGHIASKSEGDG